MTRLMASSTHSAEVAGDRAERVPTVAETRRPRRVRRAARCARRTGRARGCRGPSSSSPNQCSSDWAPRAAAPDPARTDRTAPATARSPPRARPRPTIAAPASRHSVSDPRIEHAVEQIDERLTRDVGDRDEQDAALHHRVVAEADRLDQQAADPGHAKIVSVMTAPVSTAPNCRPASVTIGIRLFRNACREHGPRSRHAACARRLHVGLAQFFEQAGARHARQDRGQRSTERDRRQHQVLEVRRARKREASQAPRRRRWPGAVRARSSASTLPPARGSSPYGRRLCRARQRRRFRAESRRRGRRAWRRAASSKVAGRRSTNLRGNRLCPCAATCRDRRAPARQGRRHTAPTSGRSRPSCWRSCATSVSGAASPSIACAGSPGMRWISEKTSVATPRSTGTVSRRRRARYVNTGSHCLSVLGPWSWSPVPF